jgi:hypothetical protein
MRSNAEAMQLLEQLLRLQPRNQLVIDVCGELRDRILDSRIERKTFDRAAYMREYMRKWRAKHG